MNKLVKDNFIEVKGDDEESLLFVNEYMSSLVFILRHQITTPKQKTWITYKPWK